MIRINLLGVGRQKARKTTTTSLFGAAQRTQAACALVMLIAMAGIGGWYWSLSQQSARMTAEVTKARGEVERLKAVLDEVKRAEERRADLEQRVKVIEDLRLAQSVPVQLLAHVSNSLPEALWLTALDQKGDFVQIEGRTTTLISLADFVANLGTNKLVTKPIDIVNSEVEGANAQSKGGVDIVKFSVKAPLTPTTPPADPNADSAKAGGRGAKPPAGAAATAGAKPRPSA
jgi:Tfp pilus assembly protein PilN